MEGASLLPLVATVDEGDAQVEAQQQVAQQVAQQEARQEPQQDAQQAAHQGPQSSDAAASDQEMPDVGVEARQSRQRRQQRRRQQESDEEYEEEEEEEEEEDSLPESDDDDGRAPFGRGRRRSTAARSTAPAPLRFRVTLKGASGASAPQRQLRTAKSGLPPQPQLTPDQLEQAERLAAKYGLGAEAARRLMPLDRDYGPSGVLLRDVCCALLRVAAGKAAAPAGEQPRSGKLQSDENEVNTVTGHPLSISLK